MTTTSLDETRAETVSRSYYDPNTAQFLTPDPLFAMTGSRYGYADNNPINEFDPSGLCSSWNPVCDVQSVAHTVNNDIVKPVERTNVETDIGVVGFVATAVALTAATGGLDLVVAAGTAEAVGFAATVTSAGVGVGLAAVDCHRHPGTTRCFFEAASAAVGVGGGAFGVAGRWFTAAGETGDLGQYIKGVGDLGLGLGSLGYGLAAKFGPDIDLDATGGNGGC